MTSKSHTYRYTQNIRA